MFCNVALESAQAHRDIALVKQMQKRQALVHALKKLFSCHVPSQAHSMGFADLQEALMNEKLSACLSRWGIPTDDCQALFMAMDSDSTITIEEFVDTCMQLGGPAQSLQLAKLTLQNQFMWQDIQEIKGFLRRSLSLQSTRMKSVRDSCSFFHGRCKCKKQRTHEKPNQSQNQSQMSLANLQDALKAQSLTGVELRNPIGDSLQRTKT